MSLITVDYGEVSGGGGTPIAGEKATQDNPMSVPCTGNAVFGFAYGWNTNTISVGSMKDGVISWEKNVLNINNNSDFTLTYANGTLTFITASWDIDYVVLAN